MFYVASAPYTAVGPDPNQGKLYITETREGLTKILPRLNVELAKPLGDVGPWPWQNVLRLPLPQFNNLLYKQGLIGPLGQVIPKVVPGSAGAASQMEVYRVD
jgi:hypothetical protein